MVVVVAAWAHICKIKHMGGSSCGWKASCLGVCICPDGCGSKAGFAFTKSSPTCGYGSKASCLGACICEIKHLGGWNGSKIEPPGGYGSKNYDLEP